MATRFILQLQFDCHYVQVKVMAIHITPHLMEDITTFKASAIMICLLSLTLQAETLPFRDAQSGGLEETEQPSTMLSHLVDQDYLFK